jgi:glycosyltransferase involved in cell wall biosynthesis
MTTEPLVSVVIPALNAAPWVRETITSCLDQTWKRLEIIVVDNGSTDGTRDIVHSMVPSGVKLFECAHQNASAARNVGTAQSNGTYVQYLDADDIIAPCKIESQLSRLLENDQDATASGPWVRFEKLPGEKEIEPEVIWQDLEPLEFLVRSWCGGGMMPTFGWLTPRRIIDRAGVWNETLTLNDDGEFFTRVILESRHIRFCPGAMGYYRTSATATLSKGTSRKALVSGLSSIDLCSQHLLRFRNDAEARKSCACYYQRFAYSAYPYERDLAEEAERKADALGGCSLAYPGGRMLQLLSAAIGWKRAMRLRYAILHSGQRN